MGFSQPFNHDEICGQNEPREEVTLTSEQVRELIMSVRRKCLAEVEGAFKELESMLNERRVDLARANGHTYVPQRNSSL